MNKLNFCPTEVPYIENDITNLCFFEQLSSISGSKNILTCDSIDMINSQNGQNNILSDIR